MADMGKIHGEELDDIIDWWEPTTKRFVAFLDILGFKERVWRNQHEDVLGALQSLLPSLDNLKSNAREIAMRRKMGKTKKNTAVMPVFFSDSILLLSGDDDWFSAFNLVLAVDSVTSEALKLGIPLKGAIAHGLQTADLRRSLYVGKPLIDAYELQDQVMMYGVVLHHTAEKIFSEIEIGDHANHKTLDEGLKGLLLSDYKTPLKKGKVRHMVITWTEDLPQLELSITKIYGNVSGDPRIYVDNTLDFVHFINEEREKLAKGNHGRVEPL